MKIYTRRGDEGKTDLRGGDRVSKTSPRVEAYGTVDEVNAVVGLAYPTGYDDVDEWLGEVQNHLHIVQAEFATPDDDTDTPTIRDEHVEALEAWIDEADEELEPLQSFIFPGGAEPGSRLHHARSVCRRAERRAVALANDEEIDETAVAYLNRLSDALFAFARLVNQREGVEERSPTY
ncbi:ATP:cob(I)alamin adenosyltransferase [Halobacteriales archaeon QS_1_68_20]|nr:MAG: ATP:cob(I)alamin adenosyltransferase [Halobacteriales archaeon QS_1_68_20]